MVTSRLVRILPALVALGVSGPAFADKLFPVERQQWKPVADSVYLQETARKIPSKAPVLSVAAYEGRCYAVVNKKVHVVQDERFVPVPSAPEDVRALETPDGSLWALADSGLFRFRNNAWQKMDGRVYVHLCMHGGVLHVATRDDVYRLENDKFVSVQPEGGYLSSDKTNLMEDGTQVLLHPVRFGPIQRIVSYSGTLYALRPGQLVLFDGRVVDENVVDWGMLPSPRTRDMLASGSRLFITTDGGLAVLRGAAEELFRESRATELQ